ncbi:MAG: hypothetical protein ACOCV1_06695 [Bacillota bacterium]
MNKSIEETHPSLQNCRYTVDGVVQEVKYLDGTVENLFRAREIQKHTVDKAVLKKIIDKVFYEGTSNLPMNYHIKLNEELNL